MALGMRAALRVLTTAAKAGAEPASYAEMVLDMLPSEQWGVLADSPTDVVLEYLAQFGDVQPHRDWFGRLHDEIKNLLTPEPDTGTTASETPGAVDTDG